MAAAHAGAATTRVAQHLHHQRVCCSLALVVTHARVCEGQNLHKGWRRRSCCVMWGGCVSFGAVVAPTSCIENRGGRAPPCASHMSSLTQMFTVCRSWTQPHNQLLTDASHVKRSLSHVTHSTRGARTSTRLLVSAREGTSSWGTGTIIRRWEGRDVAPDQRQCTRGDMQRGIGCTGGAGRHHRMPCKHRHGTSCSALASCQLVRR